MQHTKKLILHIGFPKTGSSAIQAFLSANVEKLSHSGVHYPYREPDSYIEKGLCSGNAMQLLRSMGYVDEKRGEIMYDRDFQPFFSKIIEDTLTSSHPCTLLSGEVLSQFPQQHIGLLSQLAKSINVEIIALVRDPFDFACSSWKQRVKRSGAHSSFEEDVHTRAGEQSIEMLDGFRRYRSHFDLIRLVNYDHARRDVVRAFLNACQLPEALCEGQQSNRLVNKSLRASETNLVALVNRTLPDSALGSLLVEHLLRQQSASAENYYHSAAHRFLLKHYEDVIGDINRLLPTEQKLSVQLRDQADTPDQIDTQDLRHLLTFVDQALKCPTSKSPVRRLINLFLRLRWPSLPLNFDPKAYAALNPDIQETGIRLYAHFIEQGRAAGRPYRLKGLK